MEEKIYNYSPTVMFRGTPCMFGIPYYNEGTPCMLVIPFYNHGTTLQYSD